MKRIKMIHKNLLGDPVFWKIALFTEKNKNL